MKKTLLVTSWICSGLALGSLSQNAKADETRDQIEAQGNQQIQYYWNQYQQGLQERQQAWEQGHGDRFSNAYITADAKAGAMYQEWLRSQTRLGDELHNYDVSQYEKQQNQKPQDNINGSTLTNKQSVTLQQPSESDTNTVLSNSTKDSGISTTKQIDGTYQADVPMGESLKQNNGNQESSKPVSSQQLGLTNEATWQDPDGSVHNVNSDGLDHYYKAQTKTYQYQDWSGALPDNAVIKDSDNMQHMTHQEYKQSLHSQSQQNNQQYGNGLFIKDNQPQLTGNQSSQSNSSDHTTNQSKELPQTGNTNSKAGLGGLALASLTAMFGLGKRKERY